MKKIAFLFPGQGAQSVGMGKDFFETFQEAREIFEEGNDILGRNVASIIFNGPLELLTETRNSQTGIYLTSMAMLYVLKKQFPHLQPKVCAGLSLGEYTALTASGKLTFQETLPLVQYRGEWMNKACDLSPGTMAAISGLPSAVVEEMVKELQLPKDLWVANYNCPGQTVLSGTVKGIEAGISAAKAKGAKRALPLQVGGAFHSGLMAPAREKLREKIEVLSLQESGVDMVMNVPGDYVRDKERMKQLLIDQVTSPVKWEQGIRAMMNEIDLFVEIGCGTVLKSLNRQIGVTVPTISINKISDLEELAK